MATTIRRGPEAVPLPTVPTIEAWRAMTPDERMRFQVEVNAALSTPADTMTEGRPHEKAKSRAVDALQLHFRAIGRAVYLAEEMSVLYPGEKPFSPDVFAVLDVEEPEEDERMSWSVADEGKGIDLVIEVLYRGDRDKDLVENVDRYARLGISEYFVYDRLRQQVHGFRLPKPEAARYQRIVPQSGHYRSSVLGLDLAVIHGTLRFLSGEATLPLSADLIHRLQSMVGNLEAKAEQAQAEQAQAIEGLQEAILMILEVRGIPCTDEDRACIQSCDEPAILRNWLGRARSAATASETFTADQPLR